MDDIIECKFMTLGAVGVGKTSVLKRFIYDNFSTEYDPVHEDQFRKSVVIEDKKCFFCAIDIIGEEEALLGQQNYISSCEGFFLIYSVSSLNSFDRAKELYEMVVRKKEYEAYKPLILVGNKADLTEERVVSEDMGSLYAKECNIQFIEVSAKTGHNVHECVNSLLKMVLLNKIRLMQKAEKSIKKKRRCIVS